jgi:hypothetical protein
MSNIICSCGEIILKNDSTVTKVRSKILLFKSDTAFAVCKTCGKEIEVPIKKEETNDISMSYYIQKALNKSPRIIITVKK